MEFNFSDIFQIAMIQVKSVVERDIETLKRALPDLDIDMKKYSPHQIWIAFERCSFRPENIKQYLEDGGDITFYHFHVREEDWEQYSPSRRDTIRLMFTNPNLFYYRNRPPGCSPKFGPWTEAEAIFFHQRYLIFKHYGINDKFWGLFSISMERFGYSVSSWAKTMYKPELFRGLPKPEFPKMTKEEYLDSLKKEGIDRIYDGLRKSSSTNVLTLQQGDIYRSQAMLHKKHKKTKIKAQIKKIDTNEPILSRNKHKILEENEKKKTKKTKTNVKKKVVCVASDEISSSDYDNHDKTEEEEEREDQSTITNKSNMRVNKKKDPVKPNKSILHFSRHSDTQEFRVREEVYNFINQDDEKEMPDYATAEKSPDFFRMSSPPPEEKYNLAEGAMDCLTGMPMRRPMMNREGYVLDASSWEKIRNRLVEPPFPCYTFEMDDLIEITDDNCFLLAPYFINCCVGGISYK